MTHNNCKYLEPLNLGVAISADIEGEDKIYYVNQPGGSGDITQDRIFDVDIESPLALFDSGGSKPFMDVFRLATLKYMS